MDLNIVLQCLSWTAMTTTILLFFTGIPICIKIWNMKTTGDISGVPFLMGFLGGSFWLRYGFLKNDYTMVTVNVVASSMFFCYCLFYLLFADPKKDFTVKFTIVITLIVAMLFWVEYAPNLDYLGVVCMTFNIINFGAPLAGLGVVLRKRCCDSLPLPMCFFNLLVSAQWFLYGNIVKDRYIMIPNGIGMALAVIQLSLFIIFPQKAEQPSLLQRLCGSKKTPSNECEKEPMNQPNESNSPVLGDPSIASTRTSSTPTLPSLYRTPDSDGLYQKDYEITK